MIAAIYARVSKEKVGVTEDAKSPTRQVDNAKAFALAKGWTVANAHVYIDDGISGTEFKKRPGFMRLMGALTPKAPFRVLIVSEQKSIGREMSETAMTIKQLAQAGVEIFEYVHGQSLTPKNYIDKLMSPVQGFADEDHREQTSERVHESFVAKAKKGHVVGGRVFGYDNRHIFKGEDASGNPLKSHTERVINPAEAAVVRRIFALYDAGEGLKRIAMQLNGEHAACPKPFVRKDPTKVLPVAGWAPGTVRTILMRELYHGVVIWNKTRKRDDFRQVNQRPRPESEWLRADAPHLRIIDEPLWKRVQSRRQDAETLAARLAGGRLSGRPPKTATQNLLAGLATCALCGGGLVVETSPRKRGRVPEYICYRHRANGACTNALRMPVEDMNEAVLQAVEEHALTPEAIEQVIHLSERDDVTELQGEAGTRAEGHREAHRAARRGDRDGWRRGVARRQAPRTGSASARHRRRGDEPPARAAAGASGHREPAGRVAAAAARLDDAGAHRAPAHSARAVDVHATRGRAGLRLRGADALRQAVHRHRRRDPDVGEATGETGPRHIGPEDTFDGDYGRLLDRAYERSVKVLASPTGFEPVFWP